MNVHLTHFPTKKVRFLYHSARERVTVPFDPYSSRQVVCHFAVTTGPVRFRIRKLYNLTSATTKNA